MPIFEEFPQAQVPREGLSAPDESLEPIAIIGLSLKFPQDVTSPRAFWDMLVEGRSAMTEMPKHRFNLEAYYHPNSEKPGTVGPIYFLGLSMYTANIADTNC